MHIFLVKDILILLGKFEIGQFWPGGEIVKFILCYAMAIEKLHDSGKQVL